MHRFASTIILAFMSLLAQAQPVVRLDSLPAGGTLLNKGWKFHTGDKPDWARPDLDDSKWESIDPTKDIMDLPQLDKTAGKIGWFRLRLLVDSSLNRQLVMQISQSGASEIYLNGRLIHRLGVIGKKPAETMAFTPNNSPVALPVSGNGVQLLAVRYALQPGIRYGKQFGTSNPGFVVQFDTTEGGVSRYTDKLLEMHNGPLYAGAFGILGILFLTFYGFFPKRKESLFFAIYSVLLAVVWYFFHNVKIPLNTINIFLYNNAFLIAQTIAYSCMLNSVYIILNQKRGWPFWALILLGAGAIVSGTYVYSWGWMIFGFAFTNLINIDITRIAIVALRQQQKGAWILVSGGGVYLLCWLIFSLQFLGVLNSWSILNFFSMSILSIPVSFAVFFGYDFGLINRSLRQKLTEVETLSAEKQQILATQNETLERQVAERTAELVSKNRELEIEGALERVRSKTMAMQQSDELAGAISVLCKEILALGIHNEDMETCYITTFEGSEPIGEIYSTTSNGDLIPDSFKARYDEDYVFRQLFAAWKNNDSFFVIHAEGDELLKHFAFLYNSIPPTSPIRELRAEDHRKLPSETFTHALYFSQGYLAVITRKPVPEYHEVFKRFGNALQQAYVRFLDLQKAETQAREAQVEVALERVRSRTMAMQRSSELTEAANLLFQQVQALGIPAWSCGYNIWEKHETQCLGWMSTQNLLQPPFQIPLTESPTFLRFYESRQRGEEFYTETVGGDALAAHYRYMLSLPDFKKIAEDHVNAGFEFPTFQINHVANFSHGNLIFITGTPVPEAHDIFRRFATVFDLTYTRFLDLQKAEASAKEAIRQASLDRVRAEIASMRTVGDLQRITPIVWNELTIQTITFIRCGVFIMDDAAQQIHTFLSNASGQAIAAFHLDYHLSAPIAEVVEHWHRRQLYASHWSLDDMATLADSVVAQGAAPSRNTYLAGLPAEGIYPHFFPFPQGMLYVGSPHALTTDERHVGQSVADAFATAYARYEDFSQLEAAKQQVDNTLAELKQTQQQLIQKEKLASLGELTAGIAHEIQNPLNFVNNFAQVSSELVGDLKAELAKGDTAEVNLLADDLRQNLEKISHHGQRASGIVRGMLEHSRVSTGERIPTDLNALADEYLRLAYQGQRAKDKAFQAELVTDFAPDLPLVSVVPPDMSRVLLNLYTNAFYAIQQRAKQGEAGYQPTVRLTTECTATGMCIRVQDNGTGMPDAVKAKIFQPFFTTKPTGEGTGLGLSLSYDIITKGHGGTLTVESTSGEGTTFSLHLPLLN